MDLPDAGYLDVLAFLQPGLVTTCTPGGQMGETPLPAALQAPKGGRDPLASNTPAWPCTAGLLIEVSPGGAGDSGKRHRNA